MSRRVLMPRTAATHQARDRMAPGGRLWSESPIEPFFRPIGEVPLEVVVPPDEFGNFKENYTNMRVWGSVYNFGPPYNTFNFVDSKGLLAGVTPPPDYPGPDSDGRYGFAFTRPDHSYGVSLFPLPPKPYDGVRYNPYDPWSTITWTRPIGTVDVGLESNSQMGYAFVLPDGFPTTAQADREGTYSYSGTWVSYNYDTDGETHLTRDFAGSMDAFLVPTLVGGSSTDSMTINIANQLRYNNAPVTPNLPAGVEMGSFCWTWGQSTVSIAPGMQSITCAPPAAGSSITTSRIGIYFKWTGATGHQYVITRGPITCTRSDGTGSILGDPPGGLLSDAAAYAQVAAAVWPGDVIYGYETNYGNFLLWWKDNGS